MSYIDQLFDLIGFCVNTLVDDFPKLQYTGPYFYFVILFTLENDNTHHKPANMLVFWYRNHDYAYHNKQTRKHRLNKSQKKNNKTIMPFFINVLETNNFAILHLEKKWDEGME